MKNAFRKTVFFILVSMLFMPAVHANTFFLPGDTSHLSADTAKRLTGIKPAGIFSNYASPENSADDAVEYKLLNAVNEDIKTPAGIRALFHFLKSNKLKNASRNKRIAYRLYFGLAKNFVRMKLYPLAMQCYYQALLQSGGKTPEKDSSLNDVQNDAAIAFITNNTPTTPFRGADADSLPENLLSLDSIVDYLPYTETVFAQYLHQQYASRPVRNEAIIHSFTNGKQASAYAIVLHVKQPVPGKRKSFTLVNNVGHCFITLIKYNTDSGFVTRSFGFYPEKDNLFAATPLHPSSASVLKDDALHDWDEAIGKFISRRRFDKIIRLIDRYDARNYHLNKNNCTDFGLYAATIAGVSIDNTMGKWPLGKGNTPGNTGQSILEGKILNTDTGDTRELFICTNVKGK